MITVPSASLTHTAGPSESTKIKQLAVVAEIEDISESPLRAPLLEWQGKLMEAQSAGRDCPGSGAAGPQSGCGLDRNTRTGRIYCALLALIPSFCYNYIIN